LGYYTQTLAAMQTHMCTQTRTQVQLESKEQKIKCCLYLNIHLNSWYSKLK